MAKAALSADDQSRCLTLVPSILDILERAGEESDYSSTSDSALSNLAALVESVLASGSDSLEEDDRTALQSFSDIFHSQPADILESIEGGEHIDLRESVCCEGLELKVDRKAGLIRGVKVLGERSMNEGGRTYTPACRKGAIRLLEGMKVNVDHVEPGSRRSYHDRNGFLCGLHESGDGVYGNYRYNPKHPLTEQLLWDAENAPGNVGFSIDARGIKRMDQHGKILIESLELVRSVDLVADPATAVGLFESVDPAKPVNLSEGELAQKLKLDELQSKRWRLMDITGQLIRRCLDDTLTSIEDKRKRMADILDEWAAEAKLLLATTVQEGVVQTKIEQDKLNNRQWELTSAANTLIREAIDDKALTPTQKKVKIIETLDDLEVELKKLLATSLSSASPQAGVSVSPMKESLEMDLMKLTLAELKESRADLVESLKTEVATPVQQQLAAKEQELAAKTGEISTLQEQLAVFQEKDRKAALEIEIQEELKAAKGPRGMTLNPGDKAQVSDAFLESLRTAPTKEARTALIADRVNLLESAAKPLVPEGSAYSGSLHAAAASPDKSDPVALAKAWTRRG
jgi:hypothetical protein